jgi:uncharacterized protein (DUF2132 family)
MKMNENENNEQERLPTWSDIFYGGGDKHCLKMMQVIENNGHGDSVERYLLDLHLNYGFSKAELKARVLDMLYGSHMKMYSYQGWDSLTTRITPCSCCGGEEE